MKILIKSLLQKSGLFVWFLHLKQIILAIFAHSGELNPSLNNSPDKDAALSAFSFTFFVSFPFLD